MVTNATARLRFVQWNDVHISASREPYPLAAERRQWALECLQGRHGFARPDFLLSVGDLIDGGPHAKQRVDDFAKLKAELFDHINIPILPCVGNHENDHREGDPECTAEYDAFFGPRRRNYAFTTSGITFIVVDTSGAELPPGDKTAPRNSFLKRAFENFADTPIILVSHAPLLYIRDPKVLAQSFGLPNWEIVDHSLRKIAMQHADRILAIVSGHEHLSGMTSYEGLLQINPAGVGGYPSNFAEYALYEDRLDVKFHRPPEALLDKRGDIHGPPRYTQSFTDGAHPTHEAYLWGNADENGCSIPLAGLKRPRQGAPATLTVCEEIAPGKWQAVGV